MSLLSGKFHSCRLKKSFFICMICDRLLITLFYCITICESDRLFWSLCLTTNQEVAGSILAAPTISKVD